MAFIDEINNIRKEEKKVETPEQIISQIETAVRKYIDLLLEISEKEIKKGNFERKKRWFSNRTINELTIEDYLLPTVVWNSDPVVGSYAVNCFWKLRAMEGGLPLGNRIVINHKEAEYYRFFLRRLLELARKEGFKVIIHKRNDYTRKNSSCKVITKFEFVITWEEK